MYYQHISHDIIIRVEVDYVPHDEHSHGKDQYVWAYHITMENGGQDTVQLRTRHWSIMDGRGQVHLVEGEGVVGDKPVLKPGQSYTYTSGCPLPTPSGSMSGYYMFRRDNGQNLKVIIPTFSLDLPDSRRVLN